MSWRLVALALVAVAACAPEMKVRKGEPQTAREKMMAEEKAKKDSDKDVADDAKPPGSKQWNGWRYQGDRKQCFFLVGRKCFKTENAACQAAKCKAPTTCTTEGAGPATMTCSAGDKHDDSNTDESAESAEKTEKTEKKPKKPKAKP